MELLAVNIVGSWVYGSLLMLVSLGLTLVFGLGRVVNFAVGVFYALGAYFMLTLLPYVGYWACLLLAPPVVAVVGLALERGVIRPIRGRSEIYTLLATFALAITFTGIIQTGWDPRPRIIESPVGGAFDILGGLFPKWRVYGAAIAMLTGLAVWLTLYKTTAGLRIRAASDNRVMASLLGLDTYGVLTATFTLSCGMAALAGVLAGPMLSVRATMGNDLLVDAFLAVIVGGLGSLRGAIAGAYLIAMLKSVPIGWLEAEWASVLAFSLVVLIMLVRPAGLFGEGRIE